MCWPDIWLLDPVTWAWSATSPIPGDPPTHFGYMAKTGTSFVLSGGVAGDTYPNDHTEVSDVLEFDGTKWNSYPQSPAFPVSWSSVFYWRGTVFVMAGDTGNDSGNFNTVFVSNDLYRGIANSPSSTGAGGTSGTD